jgi:hypothetical protein
MPGDAEELWNSLRIVESAVLVPGEEQHSKIKEARL